MITREDVLDRPTDPLVHRGVPVHNRSVNGRSSLPGESGSGWAVDVGTLFIRPSSPWKTGAVNASTGISATNC